MGRSNKGKKQEEQATQNNDIRRRQDYTGRDTALTGYNKSVQGLIDQPGYAPQDLQAMNEERAAGTNALYGSEGDMLTRHAAQTGWANDAGLAPQLNNISRQRAMGITAGQNSVASEQAQQVLNTRRSIPGLQFNPAQLYSSDIASTRGANTQLIDTRVQADNQPTFLQSLALAGVEGASKTAAAYAGKP